MSCFGGQCIVSNFDDFQFSCANKLTYQGKKLSCFDNYKNHWPVCWFVINGLISRLFIASKVFFFFSHNRTMVIYPTVNVDRFKSEKFWMVEENSLVNLK